MITSANLTSTIKARWPGLALDTLCGNVKVCVVGMEICKFLPVGGDWYCCYAGAWNPKPVPDLNTACELLDAKIREIQKQLQFVLG